MARKQMITREIKGIEYKVKAVTSDDEIVKVYIELPASLDAKKVRYELEKACEEKGVDMVKVLDTVETTHMYGMEIADFMAQAIELDPETRSPLKKD